VQFVGPTPLSLQVWIKGLAIAHRRAPASEPANTMSDQVRRLSPTCRARMRQCSSRITAAVV
jgi:hypothetical protein